MQLKMFAHGDKSRADPGCVRVCVRVCVEGRLRRNPSFQNPEFTPTFIIHRGFGERVSAFLLCPNH